MTNEQLKHRRDWHALLDSIYQEPPAGHRWLIPGEMTEDGDLVKCVLPPFVPVVAGGTLVTCNLHHYFVRKLN